MEQCELCELPLAQCPHGVATARKERIDAAATLDISPTGTAHFPGCQNKGDDPDFSKWGEVDGTGAWQRLGKGETIKATGGANPKVTAKRRCDHCVDHGPWI